MPHDFKKFPELTDNQMEVYYFESPHKQITENFIAKCVKVTDGDTIRVETDFRKFNFPIRFALINAPEMKEGGKESKKWLENQILNQEVEVLINKKNRVDKYGRLIGEIIWGGFNMGEESVRSGNARIFGKEIDGSIPDFNTTLEVANKW